MDGARNAVALLDVELGEVESGEGTGFLNITLGAGIHNVPHVETLHGLVLWYRSATVAAANGTNASASVLGTATVSTLGGHGYRQTDFQQSSRI